MNAPPLITIFVRHSADCKYAGDEFTKRCNCRKHFRWTQNGKQYRLKANTRSWEEADKQKRLLEDQLAGRPVQADEESGKLLSEAIDTFKGSKKSQLKPRTLAMYARELERLTKFSNARGLFTVDRALTLDNLIGLRATWDATYPAAISRVVVQKHLNHFLRFCYNAGWIARIPKLSSIKADGPETQPLTDAEYRRVLAKASGKTRTMIELMRWSGLAVRDASTLKRSDLLFDETKKIYKIVRPRTKTKVPLYIPIPPEVGEELKAVLNGNTVYVFWEHSKAMSSEYSYAGHWSERIAKVFREAGIKSEGHLMGHRLRSTFAVDLLQKGVPLEHVSKLLGHKSVTTTERHYAKWIKGRQDLLDSIVSETWS